MTSSSPPRCACSSRTSRRGPKPAAPPHAHAEAGLGDVVTLLAPVAGARSAWHLHVIRHREPDALAARRIGDKAYYRVPVHRQPATRPWRADAELPVTEEVARRHLAISMRPSLTADDARAVTTALRHAPRAAPA